MRNALLTGLLLALSACGGSTTSPTAPIGTLEPVVVPDTPVMKPPPTPDPGTKPDVGDPDKPGTGNQPVQEPEAELPVAPKASPSEPRWPELQKTVPTYSLTLSQGDYDQLYAHINDPPSKKFSVMGKFEHAGRTYPVELAFRGRSTKTDPRIVKKSWDVRFDKESRFQNRKNIELLASWKDSGYLTEKLWYDMAASVGLRVPYARYAQVKLRLVQANGDVVVKYEGVFTELESINKDFLKGHDFDSGGDIYRCGMHDCEMRPSPQESYQEKWDKKTNEEAPWDGLNTLLDGISRTPPDQFAAFVEQKLALEDYFTWLAVETFIANDLQGDSRSYLVYDRTTAKWTYVPWDLNNALSLYNRTNAVVQGVKRSHPLLSFTAYDPHVYELSDFRGTFPGMEDMKPGWSTLSTRIYDDPALRARYAARLRALLDTWFTEANLNARVNAMHALIAPYIMPGADGTTLDPYVSPQHVARSVDYLHRFVKDRRAWLRQNLDGIESLSHGALVIDRVGRDASGAFWVQLYNRGGQPVALDALKLSGFTRVPKQWALPARTLAPGEVATFHQDAPGADHLGAMLDAARPEVSLYSADGKQALDLLWLAPMAPGESYGRTPRGAEAFGVQAGPQ